MPPKKGAAAKAKSKPSGETPIDTQNVAGSKRSKQNDQPEETANADPKANAKDEASSETSNTSKKRKQAGDGSSEQPVKASRRSGRGGSKPQPTQQALLNYLLSKDAEELCRPEDETEDIKTRGNGTRTYSSAVLNPFEELMSAVILSRPISHRLGLRSIRTVINDPYNFTNAKAIKDAGEEKRHQALWDAKTQHKGKTADQLAGLADFVLEKLSKDGKDDGSDLTKTLGNDDVDEALAILKKEIKGLGPTGLDIFLRRVQWLWPAAFPYIDARTRQSLKQVGLPQDAEELEAVLNEHWSKLDTKNLAGDDEAARKRRAFVVVLERAIGADLESKVDALIEAANSAS